MVRINSLTHAGTLGMKWGQRNYQNKDGSWTPSGLERRKVMEGWGTPSKVKKVKVKKAKRQKPDRKPWTKMTDQELREQVNRWKLEREYKSLLAEQSGLGKAKKTVAKLLSKFADKGVEALGQKVGQAIGDSYAVKKRVKTEEKYGRREARAKANKEDYIKRRGIKRQAMAKRLENELKGR